MKKLSNLCLVFLAATGLAVAQQSKSIQAAPECFSDAKTAMAKNDAAPAPEVKVKGFQMPEFPGGKEELEAYLDKNIKYPAQAKKDKVQGDVFVKFMVKKDGTVLMPKVISGLDAECDKEAMRVLAAMPKWIPGKKDDQPVDMSYTMPIHFVIE